MLALRCLSDTRALRARRDYKTRGSALREELVRSLVNYWRGLGRRVVTFLDDGIAGAPITLDSWSIVVYVGLIWTLRVSL